MHVFGCTVHVHRALTTARLQFSAPTFAHSVGGKRWLTPGFSLSSVDQNILEIALSAILCPAVSAASLQGREINWQQRGGARGWFRPGGGVHHATYLKSMEDNLAQRFLFFFFF